MELKKSEKADLENKKDVFLLIGLVLSLGISLLAFEWTSRPTQVSTLGTLDAVEVEEEVIPITRQEQITTPPPAPPPTVVEVLNIVDNATQVNDDLSIFDSEADHETFVDVAPIVAAKEEKEEEEEAQVFFIVEEMPEFPGGEEARTRFLLENIKYPQMARESGIQGVVYVTFVVEPDGSISNVRVIRGIGGGCDEEAIRVVKMMPKWIPGNQRGKPVRVQFNMPIKFTLQ